MKVSIRCERREDGRRCPDSGGYHVFLGKHPRTGENQATRSAVCLKHKDKRHLYISTEMAKRKGVVFV